MRTSKEQFLNTQKAFADELHAARTYTDDLSNQKGIDKTRKLLEERARGKYAKEISNHREALYYDRDPEAFDKHRPKLDWNNPGAVAKAQAKWTSVQGKLDAGLSIGQIIATADDSTLVAINEFYADHAEAQAVKAGDPTRYEMPDVSAVHRAVDDRAAEVKGSNAASALRTAREAAGLHACAGVVLDHLQGIAEGRAVSLSDLHVAVAADQAEQAAKAGGSKIFENHDPNQDAGQEPAMSE